MGNPSPKNNPRIILFQLKFLKAPSGPIGLVQVHPGTCASYLGAVTCCGADCLTWSINLRAQLGTHLFIFVSDMAADAKNECTPWPCSCNPPNSMNGPVKIQCLDHDKCGASGYVIHACHSIEAICRTDVSPPMTATSQQCR